MMLLILFFMKKILNRPATSKNNEEQKFHHLIKISIPHYLDILFVEIIKTILNHKHKYVHVYE